MTIARVLGYVLMWLLGFALLSAIVWAVGSALGAFPMDGGDDEDRFDPGTRLPAEEEVESRSGSGRGGEPS